MKRLSLLGGMLLLAIGAVAAPPDWWEKDATKIIDPESEESGNYSPANLGQLKHVAKQAMYHLEIGLVRKGGAKSSIQNLVVGFEPVAGESYSPTELEDIQKANYAPVNLGQLKAVSKAFYDRLLEEGVDTRSNLISKGYPDTWPHNYPWDPLTPISENYAPANLGQLKIVFSFELESPVGVDTDGDGLSDAWEIANGFDPNDGDENNNGIPDGLEDPNEDGKSTLVEQLLGRDPSKELMVDSGNDLELVVFSKFED